MRQVLSAVNQRKAAGLDGVPGRLLKACSDQLTEVYTKIFNTFLAQANIPPFLKSAIILPLPKKSTPDSLTDYKQVALLL